MIIVINVFFYLYANFIIVTRYRSTIDYVDIGSLDLWILVPARKLIVLNSSIRHRILARVGEPGCLFFTLCFTSFLWCSFIRRVSYFIKPFIDFLKVSSLQTSIDLRIQMLCSNATYLKQRFGHTHPSPLDGSYH